VKLDETAGVLKVVFSDSYVDHMTLGSSTESGLLTCLLDAYIQEALRRAVPS